MSDAQKIATVLPEVKKLLAEDEAAKVAETIKAPDAEPIAPTVAGALGLPAEPVKPEVKNAGYVDTTKLAPKKEGYAADTDNKKFFDFVQDRYRSGSLGVAPGYNFYSDNPLYNDKLVEEYKNRYPELAAEYAKNADAASYQKVVNPAQKNEHELADFWDYAAGRQEKDDLKNLYMYGFKSDDPRANPEIMQRLKDENPWLWEEYQKSMAETSAATPPPGDAVPPVSDVPKPEGGQGTMQGESKPEGEKEKTLNIMRVLGNAGYSALEILQAGLAGRAGETDFDKTMAGRRKLTEKEEKAAADKKAETAEERAFQEKLLKIQDANENRRLMQDQDFRKAMEERGYEHEDKKDIANHTRELEKMGYDRETAIQIAMIQKDAATQAAAVKSGGDPYGIKGMDTLDALFTQGKITAAEYEKQKGALQGKQAAVDDMAAKLGSKDAAAMIMGNQKAAEPKPEYIPGTNIPKSQTGSMSFIQPGAQPPAPTIEQQLAAAPTLAAKQKILMAAGFKEMPGSGGMWQGPAISGQPAKAVKL